MAPHARHDLPKLVIPDDNKPDQVDSKVKPEDETVKQPQPEAEASYKEEDPPPPNLPTFKDKLFSWRWRICLIINLGNFVTMNMRGSMAIALVCMSGADNIANTSGLPLTGGNVSFSNDSYIDVEPENEFNWDKSTRGVILSASMYCGFFAPFIGGLLSHRFGPRLFISVSMAAAGIANILIPEMTRLHVYALIALRFVLGACTVGNLAAFQDIWSQWAPQLERVTLVSYSISGLNIANMFSLLVSGFLCIIPTDNGWPFIFYLFGGLCLVWVVLWTLFVYNTPEEHPFITEEEKKYIADNRLGMSSGKKPSTPWLKIVTSRAVWAFVIIQASNMWCAVTLFLYLPVYLNSVLGFSIAITGTLLAVPFLFRFFGSLFWGYLSDLLLRKTQLNVTKIRKLVQTIGFCGAAIMAGLVTFVPKENGLIAVFILGVLLFFQSASMAASAIIPLDIAPRFAGILTGGFVMVGSVLGVLAPVVTSALIYGGTREVEWRIVFFILSGVYITGVIIFDIIGTAELQPWATGTTSEDVGDVEIQDKDGGEDGVSNKAFEADVPSPDSLRKCNGSVTPDVNVQRVRTISCNSNRSKTGEVAIIGVANPMGTPQMVMKFSKVPQPPRSPLSATEEKQPTFTKTKIDEVSVTSETDTSRKLDISTSVEPLDKDDDDGVIYKTRL